MLRYPSQAHRRLGPQPAGQSHLVVIPLAPAPQFALGPSQAIEPLAYHSFGALLSALKTLAPIMIGQQIIPKFLAARISANSED